MNALVATASGALSLFLVGWGAPALTTAPSHLGEWLDMGVFVPPGLGGGCPVLTPGSQHVSSGDIAPSISTSAAKNGVIVTPGQTVFYAGPAPKGVDTAVSKPKTAPAPVVTRAGGDVVVHPAPAAHTPTASAKSMRIWTVQVASFEALDQAQELEQKLCDKGYPARIVGSSRPFSVRVGVYPTSDSAMVVARHLSSREYTVFVTLARR